MASDISRCRSETGTNSVLDGVSFDCALLSVVLPTMVSDAQKRKGKNVPELGTRLDAEDEGLCREFGCVAPCCVREDCGLDAGPGLAALREILAAGAAPISGEGGMTGESALATPVLFLSILADYPGIIKVNIPFPGGGIGIRCP